MASDDIRWFTVLWRLGLFVLIFAILSGLAISPIATVFSDWAGDNPAQAQLYMDVAGAVAILVTSWIMTTLVDKRPFLTMGLRPEHVVRDVSTGLTIGTAWLGISVGVLVVAGWASPQGQVVFSVGALLVAGVSVFFNVLTQQLLVFGYVLQTIRAKAGLPIAVIASALLFSAIHSATFEGAWIPPVNVLGAGLVFGLAYAIIGSLWLPIGIHFAWNMLLGPVLGLTISGTASLGLGWTALEIDGPIAFTGGSFGIEGGLIVTFTTLALTAILILLRIRRSGRETR
ncbi:MAG: CPBP family intramembrane metalloprotease [Gammaproteobacteria bacterium]|nr:CPBP family intramembrane metalloprotease [Gammaproteobacteria bacterium]NNC57225.1 CPBP family intramembrane metalloprotease [Woeseiaceae bacterium]NNL50424.1 CPBP family intramembrane metalloprotease [Woeseiaceae bacterium]